MRTMASKYPGTCSRCGKGFERGALIVWQGRGMPVTHATCPRDHDAVVAPCWECKAPEGKFRSYGAATPVYCDACEARIRVNTLDYKLRHPAKDNSSHEDRECGDMAYEDRCAAACGL